MKFKNVKTYGIEESCVVAGMSYVIVTPDDNSQLSKQQIQDNIKKAYSMCDSGIDLFLSGIVVQFDAKVPQYVSKEQYGLVDIVSEQNLSYTIHKVDNFKKHCNEYVLPDSYNQMDRLIHLYNTASYPVLVWKGEIDFINIDIVAKDRVEMFHYLLSNVPMGYELWMRVSTNYKKLKEVYNKKSSHNTQDRAILVDFIRALPHSYLITKTNL